MGFAHAIVDVFVARLVLGISRVERNTYMRQLGGFFAGTGNIEGAWGPSKLGVGQGWLEAWRQVGWRASMFVRAARPFQRLFHSTRPGEMIGGRQDESRVLLHC